MAAKQIKPSNPRVQDMTGQVFGCWTVIGFSHRKQEETGTRLYWLCKCSCGTERAVSGKTLRNGDSRSCGCAGNVKHGMSHSPEYTAWAAMIQRCENPKNPGFPNWGGRGIRVCSRWRKSFAAFLADVGSRPDPHFSLERINNERGYYPGNVKWQPRREQTRNTRRVHHLIFRGETHTTWEWAEILGIEQKVIRSRLEKGWPIERILSEPVNIRVTRQITWKGQTHTIKEWSALVGIPCGVLAHRLERNWPLDSIFTKPVRKRRNQ
jgi:hypothetical protein